MKVEKGEKNDNLFFPEALADRTTSCFFIAPLILNFDYYYCLVHLIYD